jgi:hypothetical protein
MWDFSNEGRVTTTTPVGVACPAKRPYCISVRPRRCGRSKGSTALIEGMSA